MSELIKILKIATIFAAIAFLIALTVFPKTNCQVCKLDYESRLIDGYEAFEIFEDACISYNKPWDNNDLEVPNITNTTFKVASFTLCIPFTFFFIIWYHIIV